MEPPVELPKRKRTATAETKKKQSDAHSGDKHHYFGLARSGETKAKIAKTLSSITRYDFDAATPLPQHMKTVNDSGTIGYMIVGHTILGNSKIKFTSKLSMSDSDVIAKLRAKCGFYLEHLDACAANNVPATPKTEFMKGFTS